MRKLLLTLALGARCHTSASAAPLEQPPEWARDAVQTLRQEGLLEGYPDGQVRGDRSMTRYELVELLDRLEAADRHDGASRTDLAELRQMVTGLRGELDALNTRLVDPEGLEDRIDNVRP